MGLFGLGIAVGGFAVYMAICIHEFRDGMK